MILANRSGLLLSVITFKMYIPRGREDIFREASEAKDISIILLPLMLNICTLLSLNDRSLKNI